MFGTREQSTENVEVVLTDRVATIAGRALDAAGRAVRDASVILVPTDRTLWGDTSRFMSFASAGRDGAFALPNVLPGDYYVVALRGVAATEWRDPEVLDALEERYRTKKAEAATETVAKKFGEVRMNDLVKKLDKKLRIYPEDIVIALLHELQELRERVARLERAEARRERKPV